MRNNSRDTRERLKLEVQRSDGATMSDSMGEVVIPTVKSPKYDGSQIEKKKGDMK